MDRESDMRSQRVPIFDGLIDELYESCERKDSSGTCGRNGNWWQPKCTNEQGAAAHDGRVCELMLCAMTIPTTQAMLSNPNIWIGDTGATQHMTAHTKGMTNLRKDSSDAGVRMGNGNIGTTNTIGDIPSIICDNQGNKKAKTILRDVAIVPTCNYNLFSITKCMTDGWTLTGGRHYLALTKERYVIIFDIVINTPNGILYAMNMERTNTNEPAETDPESRTTMDAPDTKDDNHEDTTKNTDLGCNARNDVESENEVIKAETMDANESEMITPATRGTAMNADSEPNTSTTEANAVAIESRKGDTHNVKVDDCDVDEVKDDNNEGHEVIAATTQEVNRSDADAQDKSGANEEADRAEVKHKDSIEDEHPIDIESRKADAFEVKDDYDIDTVEENAKERNDYANEGKGEVEEKAEENEEAEETSGDVNKGKATEPDTTHYSWESQQRKKRRQVSKRK